MYVGGRLSGWESLAPEDLVVNRTSTSIQLNGIYPQIVDKLGGHRSREYEGDCDEKAAPISRHIKK